jgi:hypothetical protein
MSTPVPRTARARRRVGLWIAVALAVVVLGGVVTWTTVCPCNRTPGLVLLGSTHAEPVTDWRFANDVPLCQLQVWTRLGPRAMNLNCFATPEGELFISCSVGAKKYWCNQVGPNEPARIRLNGVVYPVVLNRALDPVVLETAWTARVKKLQVYGGGPYNPVPAPDAKRPDTWWSFRARSAAGG